MPSSTVISDYIGRGTHAARPASPPIGSAATAIYFETDTGLTFVWSGSSWINTSGSTGTVTSVALSVPGELSVGGSPITTSGTLALSWANQTGNSVFASPAGGGSGVPVFRGLVAADIPTLDAGKVTTGQFTSARLPDATTTTTGVVLVDKNASVTPHPIAYTREGLMREEPNTSVGALMQLGPGPFDGVTTGYFNSGFGVPLIGANLTTDNNIFLSFQNQGVEIFAVDEFGDVQIGHHTVDLGSFLQIYGGFNLRSNMTAGSEYFSLKDLAASSITANLFPLRAFGGDLDAYFQAVNTHALDLTSSMRWTNDVAAGLGTRLRQTKAGDFIFDVVNTFNPSPPRIVTSWTTLLTLSHTGVVNIPGSLTLSTPLATSSGGTGLATSSANQVFAGPTSGPAAAPTFRALVAADIPGLDTSKLTTGLLLPSRGGTGLDSSSASNGQLLIGNGSGFSLATLTAGSNVTITNASGTITIASTGGGGGGSSTLAGDTDVSISSPHGGQVLGYSDALSKWVNQQVAGVAATQTSAKLSADVTMTSANTYYDGPSVTLLPGIWLIEGVATIAGTTISDLSAKLWDGTTVYASGGGGRNPATTSASVSIPLMAVVSPTVTTTYKISAAADNGGLVLQAAVSTNGAGNNATYLSAIQLSGNPVGQTAPAVRCYNSANQSIPDSTATALIFNTNRVDQGTSVPQHSTSSNTSRIVCQQAGMYQISASVVWAANATGVREIYFQINGSTIIAAEQENATSASTMQQTTSTLYQLAVGDYVEIYGYQSSGGALNVLSSGNFCAEFMMARIDSGPGAVQLNTKVQLDTSPSSGSDVANGSPLTTNDWNDVWTNQTFTVDDPNSVIDVEVSSAIYVNATVASLVAARLVIDSAGTAINRNLCGAGTVAFSNAIIVGGIVSVTGLSAGLHTVKLQVYPTGTSSTLYLRTNSSPITDFLTIRVLERKQSSSPPSSTPAPAVQCSNSINYSIANNSETPIAFDTTDYDQGTSVPQHSTSTNTTRLTCQQTGVYLITGCVRWSGSPGSGETDLIVKINGTTAPAAWTNVGTDQRVMFISTTHYLYVGDYVELRVFQNSGSSLNIVAVAGQSPVFSMTRIDTGGTGAVYVPVVKTSNYTILPTDSMIVAGATGLTLTLPAASAYTGKPPLVIKNDNFTGTSIAAAGSDTIDGAATFSLSGAYQSLSLVSDSISKWRII